MSKVNDALAALAATLSAAVPANPELSAAQLEQQATVAVDAVSWLTLRGDLIAAAVADAQAPPDAAVDPPRGNEPERLTDIAGA